LINEKFEALNSEEIQLVNRYKEESQEREKIYSEKNATSIALEKKYGNKAVDPMSSWRREQLCTF